MNQGIFGRIAGIFSDRRSKAVKQYLMSLEDPERVDLQRARAESAAAMLRDSVFQEMFQRMNEMTVAEIAVSENVADRERTVLFLKIQVISEMQQTLWTFVNEYETITLDREARRRREEEAA